MPHLFVPPRVARELAEETREFGGLIDRAVHKDHVCAEWDRELRRLDPLLDMVKAPDQEVLGTPLIPGAYHVRRQCPGAPVALIPIRDEHGRPVHPPGGLLEQLKGMDMQSETVTRMRERRDRAAREAEERDKVRRREDRQANILDHYTSINQASISMNTDSPWTQTRLPAGVRAAGERKKQAG